MHHLHVIVDGRQVQWRGSVLYVRREIEEGHLHEDKREQTNCVLRPFTSTHKRLTGIRALTSAPCSRSTATVSAWPKKEAQCSGVHSRFIAKGYEKKFNRRCVNISRLFSLSLALSRSLAPFFFSFRSYFSLSFTHTHARSLHCMRSRRWVGCAAPPRPPPHLRRSLPRAAPSPCP